MAGAVTAGIGLVLLLALVAVWVVEFRRPPPPPHDPPPVAEQRVGMTGGEFTEMSVADGFTTFRVTVTSVGTGIEGLEGRSGPLTPEDRFAVVHLTVENTSRAPVLVMASGFDLVDADGRAFEPHREATIEAMALNGLPVGGDLERGQTKSYINVYEVPATTRPADIVVDSSDVVGEPTIDITG